MLKFTPSFFKQNPLASILQVHRNLPQAAFSSQQKPEVVTEEIIREKLRNKFPAAKQILVEDTSGGCGAMFNVAIEAPEFKGLSIMKQHRLVYDTLKDQLKAIHGLHLETSIPK